MTKYFSLILLCLLVVSGAHSQVSGHSPYSRFGIGILEQPGGVTNRGMGGILNPIADPYSINFFNPASYSSILRTNFQVGMTGSSMRIRSGENAVTVNTASVHEMGMVFKKQGSPWAFALGIVPYSNSGYTLSTSDSIADIGGVTYSYEGTGGISKALFGLSRSFRLAARGDSLEKTVRNDFVSHRLSIGANIDYYFGSLNQIRRTVFDNVTYYHTRIESETTLYDFGADLGVQYVAPLSAHIVDKKIESSTLLIAGISWSLNTSLHSRYNELTESFYYLGGVEIPVDTVQELNETGGTLTLPQRISGGLAVVFNFPDKGSLLVGADYRMQDWTRFSYSTGDFSAGDQLKQATTFSGGIEWNPRGLEKASNFIQRNHYRAGFRMSNSYLALRDHQISEWAASAGFSIPLLASRSASKVNFSMEYGKGGTTEDGLVEEDFTRFWLGFSFSPFIANDWFIQRKYE